MKKETEYLVSEIAVFEISRRLIIIQIIIIISCTERQLKDNDDVNDCGWVAT